MKRSNVFFWLSCALLLAGSSANAGTFDERGVYTPSGEYILDFEQDETNDFDVFKLGGAPASGLTFVEAGSPEALSGSRVLEMGGADKTSVYHRIDASAEQFRGRRVTFNLWYKAKGTDVSASILWVPGDRDSYIAPVPVPAREVGEVALSPTGRITSDGWIELTSGEVDFFFGHVVPASFLKLRDGRFVTSLDSTSTFHDPEDRVLIDAFEIVDVGEAAVPDAACTIPTEQSACGSFGTCIFAKCVDAAAAWGTPPIPEQREGFSKRIAAGVNNAQGGRSYAARGDVMSAPLLGASDASARDYWYAYLDALRQTGDGHAVPIYNLRPWKTIGGGGVCTGPGDADLLPGNDGAEVDLMVFRIHSGVDNFVTQQVRPGDIITEVDGIPWREWIARVPYYTTYYNQSDDLPILQSARLMLAAVTTGATVTFERCSNTDGTPCTEAEVETLSLDLSQLHASQIWNDQALEGHFLGYWCDWRFDAKLSYSDSQSSSGSQFLSQVIDGVRHVLFNSFSTSSQWSTAMENALSDSPEKGFLLDLREGEGGEIWLAGDFYSRFISQENKLGVYYYPPLGSLDTESYWGIIEPCSGSFWCAGMLVYLTDTFYSGPRFTTEPVAAVFGHAASSTEVAWHILNRREAPTRTFGYAAGIGALGTICSLTRMNGELRIQRLQCSDQQITGTDGARSGWLTEDFLEPDERVYQKQSDAINGIDTVIARAEAWLAEQNDMQGGQP